MHPQSMRGFERPQPRTAGERAHTISLVTLFAGVPAALVLATVWGLVVGTADFGGDPPVTEWRAILYDLPGSLLILAVPVLSTVFAAKALRARAHGAELGVWLSAGGVFLMAMVVGINAVNAVVQPYEPALHWLMRAIALAAGAAALLLARRWARTTSS